MTTGMRCHNLSKLKKYTPITWLEGREYPINDTINSLIVVNLQPSLVRTVFFNKKNYGV